MFTEVLPLGALGDLPSFSILSGDAIQVDLNVSTTVLPAPKTFDFDSLEHGGCLSKATHISAAFRHCSQAGSDESAPSTSLLLPLLGLVFIFCLLILDGCMIKSGLMLLN